MLGVNNNFRRHLALGTAQVILRQKRGEHLTRLLLDRYPREVVLAAKHSTVSHHDDVHTGAPRGDRCGNNIGAPLLGVDALLVLHPAQQGDLVTQFSGSFKIQCGGCLLHRRGQLVVERVAASFQKHDRMAHVLGILRRIDQPNARCLATFDLILQAGPRAVTVITVLALTHKKGFLQQV